MEPRDDPEKRIRDLERPLADAAQASELNGTPPPGYPPPPYGSAPPYSTAPPPLTQSPFNYGAPVPGSGRKSSGVKMLIGFAVFIGIVIVGLVGAIVWVATKSSTQDGPTASPLPNFATPSNFPSISIPSGPGTQIPGVQPSTGAGSQQSVTGVGENQTIACAEGTIVVSGVSNTVVATGHCANLVISGVQNTVTVDSADAINVSGLNNKVTWHSGTPPSVEKTGDSNVVQQG